jgi:hypothetical protein
MLILAAWFYILNFTESIQLTRNQRGKLKLNLAVFLGGKVMVSAASSNLGKTHSLLMIKSFLIWTFTLAVCLLVVGFPLVVLMATVGCLLSIVLQSVMPVSAVLLVAGCLIMFNIMAVLIAAGVLTMKGVHPKEIKWLSWLHGETEKMQTTVYAACPLTCEIKM